MFCFIIQIYRHAINPCTAVACVVADDDGDNGPFGKSPSSLNSIVHCRNRTLHIVPYMNAFHNVDCNSHDTHFHLAYTNRCHRLAPYC